MNGKTALILGATGLVGSHLLNRIVEDTDYKEVRILVRHSIDKIHNKLQQIVLDFDTLDDHTVNNIFEVDDVFCCIGTTIKKAKTREQFHKVDVEYPLAVARLARRAGAKQYSIISSLGANTKSPFFYNRVKGEIEEAMATVGYPCLHIFRPSLLLGQRQEFRLGEGVGQLVGEIFGGLLIGPFNRFRPVKAESVAIAMLQAMKNNYTGVQVYNSSKIVEMSKYSTIDAF